MTNERRINSKEMEQDQVFLERKSFSLLKRVVKAIGWILLAIIFFVLSPILFFLTGGVIVAYLQDYSWEIEYVKNFKKFTVNLILWSYAVGGAVALFICLSLTHLDNEGAIFIYALSISLSFVISYFLFAMFYCSDL